MSGEADESDLALPPRLNCRLDSAIEDPAGIFFVCHIVELKQVDMVGLEPLETLIQLTVECCRVPPVILGH